MAGNTEAISKADNTFTAIIIVNDGGPESADWPVTDSANALTYLP